MSDLSRYKKGKQYSHYCGTELCNLIDLVWLAKEMTKDGETENVLIKLEEIRKDIESLRVKISDLDGVNGILGY